MRKHLSLLTFFTLANLIFAIGQELDTTRIDKLKIIFAGDIMGHDSQIKSAYVDSTRTYNYEPTFRYISDYVSQADIAVGNLEVTLAGKPFKGYPQFSSPDELALAAKDAGFDVFIMANNHALDRGSKGFKRTITMLDSFNLVHTGTFLNESDRNENYPLIIEKNNIRLALLNYTYGTNGLTVAPPLIINRINREQIKKDLTKAQKAEPDYTIVTIHWGIEYERGENKEQKNLANYILSNGADAIIGSHPHVVQPVKFIDVKIGDTIIKKPVFYCLGNFVSNQRARFKDGGIIAELNLSRSDSTIKLDSVAYLPYWVYRDDKVQNSVFYVMPVSKYENDTNIVEFTDNDLWKFNRFKTDTRLHIKEIKETDFYFKTSTYCKEEELLVSEPDTTKVLK